MTPLTTAAHRDGDHTAGDGVPADATQSADTTIEAPPTQRRAPTRAEPLPTTAAYPPLFAVLGAHGGAGASTLTRWWVHAADTGRAWPASAATTQRVVVAARECMPGLTAAADRLREWRAHVTPPGVQVVGLVLIAPRPGDVPRTVRRYADTISELVDGIVARIGWHEQLLGCELDDLAVYTPGDPVAPAARTRRRRRADLRETVPADVARTAAAITDAIAESLAFPTPFNPSGRHHP